MATQSSFVLRTSSPDQVGILARVMGFLADRGLSVSESHDFGDATSGLFFIWARFDVTDDFDADGFRADFTGSVASALSMDWSLKSSSEKPRALVLASKMDHCLNDLLFRHRNGRLGADVVAVASNHQDARWHADRHELPFHHIPVTKESKPEAEQKLLSLIDQTQADVIVLARYMQVLSNELCKKLEGRCINIHHSALPSFKGARPYHQAHARGVKLIGATAHYVTADLDEGPIIAQEAISVDHRASAERLVEMGRDIESRVLARAVRAHAEGRVFLSGSRTVVFD